VDLDSAELAANQTLNPDFSSTRPFQGQSPYIINANVNYTNLDAGLDITAAFNVFGPRLSEVSQAGTPDIYEQPMPTMDIFVKKDIKEHFSVRIGARNLLDAKFRKTIEYKDVEYSVQEYTVGRTFTASISYNIK
jgi:outer membrane receptor protein involved in Fe transport